MCSQAGPLFRQNCLKKEVPIHFMIGAWFGVYQTVSEDGLRSTRAVFFSSNENAPVYRKKGFYTSCMPKNEEIGEIFVLKSKEL
jgi:hypothetical protein